MRAGATVADVLRTQVPIVTAGIRYVPIMQTVTIPTQIICAGIAIVTTGIAIVVAIHEALAAVTTIIYTEIAIATTREII